jgi:alpha-L-rhamnosidase
MYRVVAGIEIDEKAPGYKHIRFEPRPGGGLTSAKASVESMYGHVESGWKIADGQISITIDVPANTTATVRLPNAKLSDASEGGKPLSNHAELSNARQAGDAVLVDVGSGKYEFKSGYTPPVETKRDENPPGLFPEDHS